jgi:hypothetical protein
MNNNRKPEIILNFRVTARRGLGRPSKRLSDEIEAGLLRLNS